MTVGFQSITDAGTLQIDSGVYTYRLATKGSISVAFNQRGTITYTGVAPKLFVGPGTAVIGTFISGSTRTWTVVTIGTSTVNYWIFDVIPGGSGSSFGLQLFNAAGELTFDALQGPLNVLDTFMAGNANVTRSRIAGVNYAAHFGGYWEGTYATGTEVNGEYEAVSDYLILEVSPTNITVGRDSYSVDLQPDEFLDERTADITIILADITNL